MSPRLPADDLQYYHHHLNVIAEWLREEISRWLVHIIKVANRVLLLRLCSLCSANSASISRVNADCPSSSQSVSHTNAKCVQVQSQQFLWSPFDQNGHQTFSFFLRGQCLRLSSMTRCDQIVDRQQEDGIDRPTNRLTWFSAKRSISHNRRIICAKWVRERGRSKLQCPSVVGWMGLKRCIVSRLALSSNSWGERALSEPASHDVVVIRRWRWCPEEKEKSSSRSIIHISGSSNKNDLVRI